MTEGEAGSLVIRIVLMFGLGGLFALSEWWAMRGPAAALGVMALGLLLTCLIDITRHVEE